MRRKFLFFTLFVFLASGCIWPFGGVRKSQAPAVSGDNISLEVIDVESLVKGGKLYMMPFTAGADAAAGDALDHSSLMMVKGFSDGLAGSQKFVPVSGDDVAEADAVIKGHIEQFKVRGQFKKIAVIKVRGDLRLASTDQVVALIYAQREVVVQGRSVDEAFYHIGSAIAAKLSQ